MKINSIKTSTGYLHKSRSAERSLSKARECANERVNLKQNYNDQINTTIKSNSDGRVSFKGATPFLHTAANYVMENPIVAEAIFALLITCGLRPLTIMATAKTEEEKSKCTYQAAKSVSTGLVGLGMSVAVATPLSKAIKNVQSQGILKMPEELREQSLAAVKTGVESLKKYADELANTTGIEETFLGQVKDLIKDGKSINVKAFKGQAKGASKEFGKKLMNRAPQVYDDYINAFNAQKVINNYSGTAKNVLDKLCQPVLMPLRATITIALVPVILGALGIKKGGKKQKEAKVQQNTQQMQQVPKNPYNSLIVKTNNDLFKSFAEVNQNARK